MHEPGMKYLAKADYPDDKDGFKAACQDFNIVRRKFQCSGMKASKADKTQSLRGQLLGTSGCVPRERDKITTRKRKTLLKLTIA